jgi:hypothetical protein
MDSRISERSWSMFKITLLILVAGGLIATSPKFVFAAGVLPSPPTNVTATAGNGSATVSFIPSSIGSGTLVNYWAACGVDNTHLLYAHGNSSPLLVTGLTNGNKYYCWTLSRSSEGDSNWSTVSNSVTPTVAPASSEQVIEFYNDKLDNYFITSSASEASGIDNGSAGSGWSRTGNTFISGGDTPVCRFYGSQSPGPNSHFYTADARECANLKQLQATTPATQQRWNYEGLDFSTSLLGNNNACPSGTIPVYRAYNKGATRGLDSNHRITSNLTAYQQVTDCGWQGEGVVMCSPSGTQSGGSTICGGNTGGSGSGSGTVMLTNPANGAINQSITPTLSWSAAGNLTGYWVFVAKDQAILNALPTSATSCTGCVVSASAGAATSYAVTAGSLQAGTQYYWRVRSSLSTMSDVWSLSTTTGTTSGGAGEFNPKLLVDLLFMGKIRIAGYPLMILPGMFLYLTNTDNLPLYGPISKITNGYELNFGEGYYWPGGHRLSGILSLTYSDKIKGQSMKYLVNLSKLYDNFVYVGDGPISGTLLANQDGTENTFTLSGTILSSTGGVTVSGNAKYIKSDNCASGYPTAGSIDFISATKKQKITFTKSCDGTYTYSSY